MRTASRALAFASRWFDEATVRRVFEPLVADWQREWQEASGAHRRSVRVRGFVAFVCAVFVSSPRVLHQPLPATVSNRIVTRITRFALVVAVLQTVPFAWQANLSIAALLFLVPSGLAVAFPFAMIGAVDAIRRDHTLLPHIERSAVSKLAIAAVLFMVVLGSFVVPAANQVFRSDMYQRALRTQGTDAARTAWIQASRYAPPRGVRELTSYELLTDHGFDDDRRYLQAHIWQELSNRASAVVLPVLLLWLRWRMLDRSPGRWLPLPAPVIAIAAFAGYGFAWNFGEAWSVHMVVAVLLSFDSWWVARQNAVA
ncbi:MAG: hypothetical protein RLZZ53_422 [Acidobacteriota bacterium]